MSNLRSTAEKVIREVAGSESLRKCENYGIEKITFSSNGRDYEAVVSDDSVEFRSSIARRPEIIDRIEDVHLGDSDPDIVLSFEDDTPVLKAVCKGRELDSEKCLKKCFSIFQETIELLTK